MTCLFCDIISRRIAAAIVDESGETLAFLDHRPLFPGHVLLVPKAHIETLADLPADLLTPFFARAQLVSRAVEQALDAQGSFVAINNRVSQSVPHLHVHIVPRRRKDGLKGFFWPRTSYRDEAHLEEVRSKVAAAVTRVTQP